MVELEKEEWFERFRDKYLRATKRCKREQLDSLVNTLGIHRKSAIRLLRKRATGRKPGKRKRGPKPKYDHPSFVVALRRLWRETNYMNARHLHAAIPEWLPSLEMHDGELEQVAKELLSKISACSLSPLSPSSGTRPLS